MKKHFLFLLLLPLSCLSQNLQWAKQIKGTGYQFANAMTVDAAGNIYVTGNCEDTTDFDPGAGVYNLITPGWYSDIFVAKYDPLGNLVWAKKMGGSDIDQSTCIAVDAAGNVYTAGSFFGTADFNPSFGTYNLTAAGDDVFVSKLDANGNFVWAKQTGGAGTDVAYGLALDNAQNIYITGNFAGTADFDPGAGVSTMTSTGSDIFTWKLDPNGNLVWAKQQGGDASIEIGYAITIDDQDNIYTTGVFGDTADFDPGPGTHYLYQNGSTGLVDGFISKLDVNGNFIWANAIEGPNGMSWSYAIAVDSLYNVYTVGAFQGSCDFDGGSANFSLNSVNGLNDIFIRKEDPAGNFMWVKRIGGTSNFDQASDIALDDFGNIYFTGYFTGAVDFDPGAGTFPMTSMNNAEDIYIGILNNNGIFVNALAFNGFATDRGIAITLDNSGNVFAAGAFNGTVDFDPGAGTFNLNSAYGFDGYFLKLDALTTGLNGTSANETSINIYPNPSDGIFTLQSNEEIQQVVIRNMLGEIVLISGNKNAVETIDLSNQPAGIYFITVRSEKDVFTSRVMIR